ncbi:MAG: GspE/PulE family protein [Elusimicrobiota bacterium]
MFEEKKELETVLVERGLITEEQHQYALRQAAQEHLTFTDAVVSLGYATEDAIARVVAEEYGYTYAERGSKLLEVELDKELESTIPEVFAREHIVLPLFLQDNVLSVAISNPEDLYILENLNLVSGYKVQPYIATKTDILNTIDLLYQKGWTNIIAQTIQSGTADGTDPRDDSPSDVRVDLDRTVKGGRGAYAINLVNAILKQAIAERCSDIHLEVVDREVILRFRIDGVLHSRVPPPFQVFPPVISRLKILAKMNIAEHRLPQDGSFSMKLQNRIVDVRASVCPSAYGEKIVLRLLDKEAVSLDLDTIGFEESQKNAFLWSAQQPNGLILLTGPTGSGKTTTLYALISRIKTPRKNFMSIEDPIEIKLKGMTQLAVRTEIGLTFASALRSFLRQDPDVILVGEVRDLETAQTCLRASLTGHLVLSTLHTNDASAAIVRLLDLGTEPFLISSSISLVAAQRLVRILCPRCREAYTPTKEMLTTCFAEGMMAPPADTSGIRFYKAVGCDACSKTGYNGRIGIYEVYKINDETRNIITREHGDIGAIKECFKKRGLLTLRAAGWHKVVRGITTVDEVFMTTTTR